MKRSREVTQVNVPASVRDALDALHPVPAPDSETWATNRASFLDAVHAHALDAASTAAPETVPVSRWRRVGRPLGLIRAFLVQNRGPAALAVKAMLVVALLFGGSVGTVSAARGSLPGSLLYPLKVRIEVWEMKQARTPDDVARTALAQSDVRVAEVARLQDRGKPIPEETATRYQQQLDLAMGALVDLDEPVRQQTHEEISESVRRQLQVLERASMKRGNGTVADEAGGVDPGLEAMIRAMNETQVRLGQPGHHGSEQSGPQAPAHGPNGQVTDEDDESPAGGERTPLPDDAPSDGPGHGPGGNGNQPGPSGSDNDPGVVVPDTESPSGPADDDTHDDDAPGPGPAHGQDDARSDIPGPASEPDDTDDPRLGSRGIRRSSDNSRRPDRVEEGRSGRS